MISGTVLKKELKLVRRALLIWLFIGATFVGVYLGFFPYIQDPDMVALIERYPEAVRAAFNFSAAMFMDVNVYYAGLVMGYTLLLFSIFALMMAGGLISRDSDLGTVEFLYVKPVTRSQIFLSKIGAFFIAAVLLWVVTLIVSVFVGLAVAPDAFNVQRQIMVHASGLLATLAAGGMAFAWAPFIDQVQVTASVGVGVGLGLFLLNALGNTIDRLQFLQYFSIHYYAGFERAVQGEPFITGMVVLLGLFVGGSALGLMFMNKKQFVA